MELTPANSRKRTAAVPQAGIVRTERALPARVDPPAARALRPVWEVNARCIDLLVQAATSAQPGAFPLARHLREPLRMLAPEVRARAARKPFVLVDLEFANVRWWQLLVKTPSRAPPLPTWRGHFPRASARQLARATLTLAWQSARSERTGLNAPCRFGMATAVADTLAGLSLAELERIADRRYRFLRPRWEDHPAVWRQLLESAQTTDYRRAREFNLRALQLLLGGLMISDLLT